MPCADVLFFADARWHRWHKDRPTFQAFAGEKCSIQNTGDDMDDASVHMLRNGDTSHDDAGRLGLCEDPAALRTGYNSGYMAINLAVLAGARRIVLAGYDGRCGPANEAHFFGEHPEPTPDSVMRYWVKSFRGMTADLARLGVEVINATPGSAIDAFPREDLDAVLP